MPRLGKQDYPYTKQGYEDYEKALARKKGRKVGKKKKKKVVSRKKKRK